MRLRMLDNELRFECGSCALCCRQPWLAEVEEEKLGPIQSFDWAAKYPHLSGHQLLTEAQEGGVRRTVLGKSANGHCIFLDSDNLCIIHKELGFDAKPQICRRFPYFPAFMPDADHISANFACPSVQAATGPTLEENREQVLSATPTKSYPPGRPTDVALLLGRLIPLDAAHALADRWADCFLPETADDLWSRFARALRITAAATKTNAAELVGALQHDDFGADIETPPLQAPESLGAAPIQARMLLALNLWNDYYPPGHFGVQRPPLVTRLGLIGKVMHVVRMHGAYASRYLPGNIAMHRLDAPTMCSVGLPEESTRLLSRWVRARFRQRSFRRDRISMTAGLHQQLVDVNTVLFFARAAADRNGREQPQAEDYAHALRIVEFGISYQQRAYQKLFRKRIMSLLESYAAAWGSLCMFHPSDVCTTPRPPIRTEAIHT